MAEKKQVEFKDFMASVNKKNKEAQRQGLSSLPLLTKSVKARPCSSGKNQSVSA